MNDTVKGNVLFGANENRHLYNNALSACALTHDLEMLPAGDMTEIGEKGITMSGGQKARIALARVLYHNADISLLDDPLAAVDAHVGRHLFEKAIVQELLQGKSNAWSSGDLEKKKTVVLVTNALQYLSHPQVDRIIVLKDGHVEEEGSYAELTATDRKGGAFKSFLDSFNESMAEGSSTKADPEIASQKESVSKPKFELPLAISRATRSRSVTLAGLRMPGGLADLGRARSLGNIKAPRGSAEGADLQEEEVIALMTDEMQEREKGTVNSKVYLSWARAAGGVWVLFIIIGGYGEFVVHSSLSIDQSFKLC
jgi:ATP-binding cassette subfamily C (CFTR/MRP) protein 1